MTFPVSHQPPSSGNNIIPDSILNDNHKDIEWMNEALSLARRAESEGEVPVGAVIVKDGVRLAGGWNQPIGRNDPTAHAEIIAIREACNGAGNYRLPGATLYVTLEPCAMCSGAIIHARIARVVYGTSDPRAGAGGSVFNVLQSTQLNHRAEVVSGVCQEECSTILRQFFEARR